MGLRLIFGTGIEFASDQLQDVLHSTNFQLKASERDISAIQAITIVKDTRKSGLFFVIIWERLNWDFEGSRIGIFSCISL
jgi:hypothetical protein